MIYRQNNHISLWGESHPFTCPDEVCVCGYHLVDEDKKTVKGFMNWREADKAFCEISQEEPFAIGKFI